MHFGVLSTALCKREELVPSNGLSVLYFSVCIFNFIARNELYPVLSGIIACSDHAATGANGFAEFSELISRS
jgi:hypothetical protein